jgi:type II secretory pathway component PulJ
MGIVSHGAWKKAGHWMCISRPERRCDLRLPGFTALELLIGLSLSVCLALAVAPLGLSLQRSGVREADRAVTLLQGRVASARLERDLRLAGAGGCGFTVNAPILEASRRQVVFLTHSQPGAPLALVEWEITNGCVMRRWGQCPATRPLDFGHSLYEDHKTMVSGIDDESTFAYVVGGEIVKGAICQADLPYVRTVILELNGVDDGGMWHKAVSTWARVGR